MATQWAKLVDASGKPVIDTDIPIPLHVKANDEMILGRVRYRFLDAPIVWNRSRINGDDGVVHEDFIPALMVEIVVRESSKRDTQAV